MRPGEGSYTAVGCNDRTKAAARTDGHIVYTMARREVRTRLKDSAEDEKEQSRRISLAGAATSIIFVAT